MIEDKNLIRAHIAAAKARAEGASALDVALAMVEAGFNRPAVTFKQNVRHLIRAGEHEYHVRMRFRRRAEALREYPLDAAIQIVDWWLRLELRKPIARRSQLAVAVLSEMRLIGRWMRFDGRANEFPALIEALTESFPKLALVSEAAE